MNGQITFVLGGARSGKSRFAEKLVFETGSHKIYLATSQAFDQEMLDRIEKHQSDRGAGWVTVEEPVDINRVLKSSSEPDNVILLDCLTLWISNLMMAEKDIPSAFSDLCETLTSLEGDVILVSNEVGQGIVPDNAMARAFRDHAGLLHQEIAALADEVYFVTAGLPQKLK